MLEVIKSQPRSSPYYRDYHYTVHFYIQNASALRNLSHKAIENYVAFRGHSRWGNPPSITETKSVLANLCDMCDRLLAFKEPCKRMVYQNHVYIYSNSLEDLEIVASASYVVCSPVSRADICLPENVVLLKEPKRKFRTYLKDRWIDEHQSAVLKNFLLNRQDCYDFTPLFKYRLESWKRFYTMSHFFIDHDSPGDLMMLDLVVPGLIRKTMPIQAK